MWFGLSSGPAFAFQWAKTAATDAPLHWAETAELSWTAPPSLSDAAAQGAKAWQGIACNNGAKPPALAVQPSAEGVGGFQVHHAQWPYGQGVIALTELAHNAGSGRLSTFAVHVNGEDFTFCERACAGAQVHLSSSLAHEWGHVLGLAHSELQEAMMAPAVDPATERLTLTDDDVAGLCALYEAVAPPVVLEGGCSARPQPPGRNFLWLLGLPLLLLWRRRRVAASLCLLLVGLASVPAQAYEIAKVPSGALRRWYLPVVEYEIEQAGLAAQGLSDDLVAAEVKASFAAWEAVQCDLCHDPQGLACEPVACATHSLGMTFSFRGFTPEKTPIGCADGSTPGDDNPGCEPVSNGVQIGFVDKDWPYGTSVIAVTAVLADNLTGQITDGDILLNTAQKVFCIDEFGCQFGEYDLRNTLTHEAGHLLGLDHSAVSESTMFGGAPAGELIKRDLDPDDVAGVCYGYRIAWVATGCPPADSGGCVVSRTPTPGALWLVWLMALILVALRRRAA